MFDESVDFVEGELGATFCAASVLVVAFELLCDCWFVETEAVGCSKLEEGLEDGDWAGICDIAFFCSWNLLALKEQLTGQFRQLAVNLCLSERENGCEDLFVMNQGKNELRGPSSEGSRAAVAAVFDYLEQGFWVDDDVGPGWWLG